MAALRAAWSLTPASGLAAALGALTLVVYFWRQWWQSQRRFRFLYRLRAGGAALVKSEVCIGAIFGMDVGGTLSKVVYFEAAEKAATPKKKPRKRRSTRRRSLGPRGAGVEPEAELEKASPPAAVRKSRSFDNLERPEHMSVLREFYRIMEETRKYGATGVREEELKFYSEELGGVLHFIRFETRRMEGAMDFVAANSLHLSITHIPCTGGGAYKYDRMVKEHLGIELDKLDEMECLVRGMQFVLDNFQDEVYTYKPSPEEVAEAARERMQRKDKEFSMRCDVDYRRLRRRFPYMVVSIGTGVSMIKVEGPGKFVRVSGSSIGGGTFWGLCRLFTTCRTFKDGMDLAEDGDTTEVDMLVRDIYGGDYEQLGLPGNAVASSFGKLVAKERAKDGVRESDFARALLMMITNNIGQVSYLTAIQHDVRNIYFIGSFMRHNSISAMRLSYAIDFWSKGTMEALFLRHEGFFGALGAFLSSSYRTVPGRTRRGKRLRGRTTSLDVEPTSSPSADVRDADGLADETRGVAPRRSASERMPPELDVSDSDASEIRL